MARLPTQVRHKRLAMIVLVCATTVMASDAPPATLPQGFLEQLPLLMQLNEEEFQLLLKYTSEGNSDINRVNESTMNSSSVKMRDNDEN